MQDLHARFADGPGSVCWEERRALLAPLARVQQLATAWLTTPVQEMPLGNIYQALMSEVDMLSFAEQVGFVHVGLCIHLTVHLMCR